MFTCHGFRYTHLYTFCTNQVISCKLTRRRFHNSAKAHQESRLPLLSKSQGNGGTYCTTATPNISFSLTNTIQVLCLTLSMCGEIPTCYALSLSFRLGSRSISVAGLSVDIKHEVGCGSDWWLLEAILDVPKARRQFRANYYDTSSDEL